MKPFVLSIAILLMLPMAAVAQRPFGPLPQFMPRTRVEERGFGRFDPVLCGEEINIPSLLSFRGRGIRLCILHFPFSPPFRNL